MASIEFIEKRITGKEKELEKLNKKLVRIRKAEESGWENNPYYYSEYDLKHCIRDIEEAQKALEKYLAELTTAQEKANSRNVPAITEFLEMWKAHCRNFYGNGLKEYFKEENEVYNLYIAYADKWTDVETYEKGKKKYEEASKAFKCKKNGYFETFEYVDRFGKTRKGETKVREGEYEPYKPYITYNNYEEAMQKLEKDLVDEANRKYDFIIERTNKIVGEITDATGLKVGAKHDLNGFIIGTKGIAKVKTIGAGGYNIQCFHFRTLINKA